MFETAIKYILDLLTENEELKKFPQEFTDEAIKWVKSWFLRPEDPKTTAKLEDPNKSIEVKKDIIQDKLEDLKDNIAFQKELAERMKAFEQQKSRLKNVVSDTDIDVKGSVHIGDKGNSLGDNSVEKNIIKSSTIKAGGDFRLGDDVISGNQNVQIVHNYFNNPKGQNIPPQYSSNKKAELKSLLAQEKTGDIIDRLLDWTESSDNDLHQMVLLLSARFNRINNQELKGVVSYQEASIERNKINAALSDIIDKKLEAF